VSAPGGPDAFALADCDGPVPRRFEAWAAREPRRVAVRSAAGTVTYGALEARAARLARRLRRPRGRSAAPVAVMAGKDAPGVAAFLAVLKAGRIHVGLDGGHPPDHNGFILDDCGADTVVTSARHAAAARALAGSGRRLVVAEEVDGDALDPEDVPAPVTADAHATIVYTSGSTGRPKGVLQSHRNTLHNALNCAAGVAVRADDRFSLIQSLTGIGGIRVVLTALLNGAAIAPYDVGTHGLGALAAWIRGQGITVMSMAVTGLRHFVASLDTAERFPAVRVLKLSSEASGRGDLEALRRHFPAATLWVGLGTTETGYVTHALVRPDAPLPDRAGVLGFPVHGMDVLIVDDAGSPRPPGEIGEIVVRSRYLALGYWGRPDLTEAAFRPDPEGGDRRRYHTGDLGCLGPDGLEHRGRRDAMIKLRGHRVELGAVEHALLEIPGIARAAVVARDRAPGDTRLVAYVAPHEWPGPAPADLRAALAHRLPAYMVPAHIAMLRALPSTAAGKVDRGALPAPDWSPVVGAGARVAPRGPVERELAAIWAEVLGLDAVGVTDAFLDLGGHSLLASRIAARVLDRFPTGRAAADLLRAPTVEAMARLVVDALVESEGAAILDALDAAERQAPASGEG
jgi:amino acid adenylation domain-containing protein